MRNLKLHWHRLMNTKSVMIDGVRVSTVKENMPRSVRSLLFKGNHEIHERRLVAKYLNAGDRVLEIGAATGLVSLICVKHCGPENVLSYEANPAMEAMIRANFKLNQATPNLVMKAVTVDGGNIEFFVSDNILSSSAIDRSNTVTGTTINVESDAIDAIISRFKPTAIVMDVEGAEIELLGKADLSGINKLIVELHPHVTGAEPVEKLEASLVERGFVKTEIAHKTRYFQRG